MANTGFQFKQFFIAHDKCAMKVNTDGILLGAIADISDTRQILDLGTGTGLIAIMLAQRTACDPNTTITALELDPDAFQQAVENAQNSAWADRLNIINADVMQADFRQQFDLIVSNPPYFEHSLASRNQQRDLARAVIDSHFSWLQQATKWLRPQGKVCFILPLESADKLIMQVAQSSLNLTCSEYIAIRTKEGKAPKRAIVTFTFSAQSRKEREIVIYQQDNQYTAEFVALTKAFYLNM
ncbi:tRNA (adenine-N(6)-)-methyltransferase [Pasteurellaceae bacterium LFhippo2]|nr:tRNA (adenine-N(6)-)-methyltransferase [Pasteurellaceae bacterium LFhippo2]